MDFDFTETSAASKQTTEFQKIEYDFRRPFRREKKTDPASVAMIGDEQMIKKYLADFLQQYSYDAEKSYSGWNQLTVVTFPLGMDEELRVVLIPNAALEYPESFDGLKTAVVFFDPASDQSRRAASHAAMHFYENVPEGRVVAVEKDAENLSAEALTSLNQVMRNLRPERHFVIKGKRRFETPLFYALDLVK